MVNRDIIVIGASAGGMEPLKQLLKKLPEHLDISIFIVLHLPAHKKSFLSNILAKLTSLKVSTAEHNSKIKKKHIYVAPPDYHLILKNGFMQLSKGPKVNHSRPAIDTLFNSAALAYQNRVIGILLSGLLDDGSDGLQNIKSQGGICIVQDPKEAAQADMPLSAIALDGIDYVVTVDEMAKLLSQVTYKKSNPKKQKNLALLFDEEAQELKQTKEDVLNKIGSPSIFTCPECHGTLWEITKKKQAHYRCRIGHAFNIKNLLNTHDSELENILWAGIRALEENASLSYRIAKQLRSHTHHKAANFYMQKGKIEDVQAMELRKLFFANHSMLKGLQNGRKEKNSK